MAIEFNFGSDSGKIDVSGELKLSGFNSYAIVPVGSVSDFRTLFDGHWSTGGYDTTYETISEVNRKGDELVNSTHAMFEGYTETNELSAFVNALGVTASVEERFSTVVQNNGTAAAMWGLDVDADGVIGGIELGALSGTVTKGSYFNVKADYFRVYSPNNDVMVDGAGDPMPVFSVRSIDGIPTTVFNGKVYFTSLEGYMQYTNLLDNSLFMTTADDSKDSNVDKALARSVKVHGNNTNIDSKMSINGSLHSKYTLAKGYTAIIKQNGDAAGAYIDVTFTTSEFTELDGGTIAVRPGDVVQFSFYVGFHRCRGRVYIRRSGADGTALNTSYIKSFSTVENGGHILEEFDRVVVNYTVPSDTYYISPTVRKGESTSGATNSYMFITHPMLTPVPDMETAAVDFIAGANGFDEHNITVVDGGKIETGTVYADRLLSYDTGDDGYIANGFALDGRPTPSAGNVDGCNIYGSYISGSLIRSEGYQWNGGDPIGFSLADDKNYDTEQAGHNVVGGSMYGSKIRGANGEFTSDGTTVFGGTGYKTVLGVMSSNSGDVRTAVFKSIVGITCVNIFNESGGNGLYVSSDSSNAIQAVAHTDAFTAVLGTCINGRGGDFTGGTDGVYGEGGTYGVHGRTSSGTGVFGEGNVGGYFVGSDGNGVYCRTDSGGSTALYIHHKGTGYGIRYRNSDTMVFEVDNSGNVDATSYTPFTGAHIGLLPVESLIVGDIVNLLPNPYVVDVNDTRSKLEYVSTSKSKAVAGVLSRVSTEISLDHFGVKTPEDYGRFKEWMSDGVYDMVYHNAVGEGLINVCDEGGDIELGDYICSSNVQGKGMKQDDDILHSYTVAKASDNIVWDAEDCEIIDGHKWKQVACTYHAG